jgi:hypothetical protein
VKDQIELPCTGRSRRGRASDQAAWPEHLEVGQRLRAGGDEGLPLLASTRSPAHPTLGRLTTKQVRMTRPPSLQPHYWAFIAKPVRPCAPHRFSAPRRSCSLGSSLSQPGTETGWSPMNGRRCRGDRFTRSAQEPELSSRHLYAGHRLGSRQVAPKLIPRERLPSDSMSSLTFDTSSAVRLRSPSQLVPDALLARLSATLTTRLLTDAACGGLRPPPAGRSRRAKPPSLAQHYSSSSTFSIDPSSCSCHTVIGEPHDDHVTVGVATPPLPGRPVNDGRCWRATARPMPLGAPRPRSPSTLRPRSLPRSPICR